MRGLQVSQSLCEYTLCSSASKGYFTLGSPCHVMNASQSSNGLTICKQTMPDHPGGTCDGNSRASL